MKDSLEDGWLHSMGTAFGFKIEVRHRPDISFQADRDLRERGSRPLISNRQASCGQPHEWLL